MNAIAADQEKRFASMIWKSATLTSAGVTVGNYTGRYDPSDPGAGKDSGNRTMGERHGISHHELTADDKATVEAIEQWCNDLGHWLRDLKLFRYLLEEFDTADASGQPLTWRDLVGRLVVFDPAFAGPTRAIENETDNENGSAIVASLFALIAQAKARESRSGRSFPLVPTQGGSPSEMSAANRISAKPVLLAIS